MVHVFLWRFKISPQIIHSLDLVWGQLQNRAHRGGFVGLGDTQDSLNFDFTVWIKCADSEGDSITWRWLKGPDVTVLARPFSHANSSQDGRAGRPLGTVSHLVAHGVCTARLRGTLSLLQLTLASSRHAHQWKPHCLSHYMARHKKYI